MGDQYKKFYQYHHRGTTTVLATARDVEALEQAFKDSLSESNKIKAERTKFVTDLARDFSLLQSTKDQSVSLQGAVAIDAARVDRAVERAAVVLETGAKNNDNLNFADKVRAEREAASKAVSVFVAEKEVLDETLQRSEAYLPEGRDTVDVLAHDAQDLYASAMRAFQEIGSHAKGSGTAVVDVAEVKRLVRVIQIARSRLNKMQATHTNNMAGVGKKSNESLEKMRSAQQNIRDAADRADKIVAGADSEEDKASTDADVNTKTGREPSEEVTTETETETVEDVAAPRRQSGVSSKKFIAFLIFWIIVIYLAFS